MEEGNFINILRIQQGVASRHVARELVLGNRKGYFLFLMGIRKVYQFEDMLNQVVFSIFEGT